MGAAKIQAARAIAFTFDAWRLLADPPGEVSHNFANLTLSANLFRKISKI
jgi:hypothetical protein